MSDEEEDYMSDKFLSQLADVKPSLVQNRIKKRQLDVAAKQSECIKRQREERLERTGANSNERLQESLRRPIESSNKGFQMLAKMGYSPGQALGKNSVTNSPGNSNVNKALIEPIAITMKTNRSGLGREAALLELAEKRRQLRSEHLRKAAGGNLITTEEFRKRATQKAEERFVHGALRRCQTTCENLDKTNDIEEPEMQWFWPERLKVEESEIDNYTDEHKTNNNDAHEDEDTNPEDEYTEAEKLELLVGYLRTSYLFCFWCGTRYENQQDIESNCPGLSRDDH